MTEGHTVNPTEITEVNPSILNRKADEDQIKVSPDRNHSHHRIEALHSHWRTILIVFVVVLLFAVSILLITHSNTIQEQQQEINQLRWLLHANITPPESNCSQLQSSFNSTSLLDNSTLPDARNVSELLHGTLWEKNHLRLQLINATREKKELSLQLKKSMQEKAQQSVQLNNTLQENARLILLLNNTMGKKSQLQLETEELRNSLNSALESRHLLEQDNKKFQKLFSREQEKVMQLRAENQHQRSILLSDKLSFLWNFCDRRTLQCSRCPPGWTQHNKRCFYLPSTRSIWEVARRDCFTRGGDLALVLDATDQAFLTNMTYQFVQQHPQEKFSSAWIGLQDMVMEGRFVWVNGFKVKSTLKFWSPHQPNNALASWDKDKAGQDCVAIVPPKSIEDKDWMNSWDDVTCRGLRHHICESKALIF